METRPPKFTAKFTPRTMGVFVLLIIILSFAAGAIRRELVLTLTGAVFLAVWVYCLAMTLGLALFHRRRAGRVSISLSPEKIIAGDMTQVMYSEGKEISANSRIFQLPGILVRCRVLLSTRDNRRITYDFKPEKPGTGLVQREIFQAKKRGAYFSDYDEFAVFDILGFFRFAFRIPPETGARLLASPHAASEPVPVRARGGESDRQEGPVFERTDILIDHRPYVPGDDPRRINWKLYSHGGELFIREGEREPPPHSNMTILIDTQYDSLYTAKSARAAVDLLCENALAAAAAVGRERNVQIGFTGQTEKIRASLSQAELGHFIACPWAIPVTAKFAELPAVPEDRGIVILAMPRIYSESSALDRFISTNANRSIELIFIYGGGNESGCAERAEAAETCVALYNRRPGVKAHAVTVP